MIKVFKTCKNFAIVIGNSVLNSVMGLYFQILLLQSFGLSNNLDVFFFSQSAPFFLAAILNSSLSYSLVPKIASTAHINTFNKIVIQKFLSFSILIFILFIFLSPLAAFLQKIYFLKLSAHKIESEIFLLCFSAWFVGGIQVIMGTINSILIGLRHPIIASFSTLIPVSTCVTFLFINQKLNIIIINFILFFGYIVSIMFIWIFVKNKNDIFKFTFTFNKNLSSLKSGLMVSVATCCFSIYSVIDALIAPCVDVGILSTVNFAARVVTSLGTFLIIAPTTIVLPNIAELISQNHLQKAKKIIFYTYLCLLIFALLIFVIITILAKQDFRNTIFITPKQISYLLTGIESYLPGFVFMILSVFSLRLLFCFVGMYKTAACLGIIWVLSYFFLALYLRNYGSKGFGYSYSISWFIYLILILAPIYIQFKKIN